MSPTGRIFIILDKQTSLQEQLDTGRSSALMYFNLHDAQAYLKHNSGVQIVMAQAEEIKLTPMQKAQMALKAKQTMEF